MPTINVSEVRESHAAYVAIRKQGYHLQPINRLAGNDVVLLTPIQLKNGPQQVLAANVYDHIARFSNWWPPRHDAAEGQQYILVYEDKSEGGWVTVTNSGYEDPLVPEAYFIQVQPASHKDQQAMFDEMVDNLGG